MLQYCMRQTLFSDFWVAVCAPDTPFAAFWAAEQLFTAFSNTSREWKLASLCFIPMMLLYASVVCEEELLLTSFYFRSTARYTVLVQSARTSE